MKSLFSIAFAAIAFAASAGLMFEDVKSEISHAIGKAVAVSVKSGTADDSVSIKRVRHVGLYTNGVEIVSGVVTNSIHMFDNSNNKWYYTNIVSTVVSTNTVKLLAFGLWETNEIASVVCSGGFATSNIVDGVLFFPGDFIVEEGADKGAIVTVAFEK